MEFFGILPYLLNKHLLRTIYYKAASIKAVYSKNTTSKTHFTPLWTKYYFLNVWKFFWKYVWKYVWKKGWHTCLTWYICTAKLFELKVRLKDDMLDSHNTFVLQNYQSWKYVLWMTCMSCMIHLYCKNIRVESTFEKWHACLLVPFMKYTLTVIY